MIHRFKIGVDLSINSTGITVCNLDTLDTAFYIVSNHFTKQALKNEQSWINLVQYNKLTDSKAEYEVKEIYKTKNLMSIFNEIEEIINKYLSIGEVESIRVEGLSFGSMANTVSILELSALNYMVRFYCMKNAIDLKIIQPTQLKKFATGNGHSNKDVMVYCFTKLHPWSVSGDVGGIKIDDVADSYFLCMYE